MISDAEVKLAAIRAECDEALRGVLPDARDIVMVTISALDLLTILKWIGLRIDRRDSKASNN